MDVYSVFGRLSEIIGSTTDCEMIEKINKMQQMLIFNNITTCFGHHYAHFQENKTYYCMWCAALILLDVVVSGCGALPCGV